MKKIAPLCLGFLLAMALASPAVPAETPPADPAALWDHITKADPYTKWGQWQDYKGMQKSHSPHGDQNRVFVNLIGLSAKKPPMPFGSIQVKESFDDSGRLLNITVMYKVKGYNPPAGDWFWAKYAADGRASPFGKPKGCIACHAGAGGKNDYVTVHKF